MDWIITLPKTVKWVDYEHELRAAEAGSVLSYRVPFKAGVAKGDRVFVVWYGRVRGFMTATGTVYLDQLICSTTGAEWRPGWYVQRTGRFFAFDGCAMKGFRGIRRTRLFEGYQYEEEG